MKLPERYRDGLTPYVLLWFAAETAAYFVVVSGVAWLTRGLFR